MVPTVPTSHELLQLDFFSGLDEADVAALAARAYMRRLDVGEAFFHEGDELEPALRLVCSGHIAIRRSAASGKETIIRLIRAGEVFGVAAMFDRKLAPASAVATMPTTVLEIRMADFMAHLREQPAIAIKLLVTFSERLRDMQDTLHTVVSGRAKTRLARLILRTLERDGAVETPAGLKLRTKLPHATLSRMVGITYEECVRQIRDWCHDPAVVRYERGGELTLLDVGELQRQAADD